MNRKLKTIVVLLMLGLLPLRALATVTVGFCAMHHPGSGWLEAGHGDSHDNHNGPQHGDGKHEQCNACIEHCSSASLLSSAELTLPPAASAARIVTGERFAAGFVPERLDPPPLAH